MVLFSIYPLKVRTMTHPKSLSGDIVGHSIGLCEFDVWPF